MYSIADFFKENKPIFDSFEKFIKKHIPASLLRKCNITKVVDSIEPNNESSYPDGPLIRLIGSPEKSKFLEKCISAKQLLIDHLVLCFHPGTAYRMFQTDTFYGDYKKDTYYRFGLLPHANWERLQIEVSHSVITDIENATDSNHANALIFDDSLYQRMRGKGTQLCSKVFDHNDRKTRLGFRMMTGGWTNGNVYIPFAQSLLTSRDDKLMVGPDEKYDGRTIEGKRRKRAKTKGTDVVFQMVQEAQKIGIPFDNVLFDTWFSSPSQLIALKSIGADVIAMIKKSSTKYTVCTDPKNGTEQKLDVKEIYSRNRKRRGQSKYLLSISVKVSDQSGATIPAKLVYARNHSNRKDWVCFVCTDMSLSEEEILKRYLLRWNTETYFKVCKSYLKLRTECHSPNYDAITAHMVIVAIRYMVLAEERFYNTDNRTLEEIFYGVQREVISQMIDTAIVILLDAMLDSVRKFFNATEEQIRSLVHNFISELPEIWKKRFEDPVLA